MKLEQTECFETSAHKIQRPENHPTERIQLNSCTYIWQWSHLLFCSQ